MATIIKTPAGTFRAIIRTPNKTLTKTFKLRKLAKAWAVRTEGDADLIALTGCKGASIPFSQLADEFHNQWQGKDDITGKIRDPSLPVYSLSSRRRRDLSASCAKIPRRSYLTSLGMTAKSVNYF